MFWISAQTVTTFLLLIGLGCYLCGTSWFGGHGPGIFSKFCVTVAIPSSLIVSIYNGCQNRRQLFALLRSMPVAAASILLNYLLGLLLVRALRVPDRRRGVFINAVTFSNAVFVGFPIVQALLGEQALTDAMVYYFANTMLFWTIGVYQLRKDSGGAPRFLSRQSLRNILSPPMLGAMIGVALVLLSLEIPPLLYDTLSMLGATGIPLAMIFIGSIIRQTDFRAMRLTRDMLAILLVRFVWSPAVMVVFCLMLPLSVQLKQVLFVYSVIPVITQLGIMAKETGSDVEFASLAISVSTLVSIAVIPLYIGLMQHFGLFQ